MQNVIQRIYKLHIFKIFRHFIEGIIWFLLHFYAIQAISHIEVFLSFRFHLMHSQLFLLNNYYYVSAYIRNSGLPYWVGSRAPMGMHLPGTHQAKLCMDNPLLSSAHHKSCIHTIPSLMVVILYTSHTLSGYCLARLVRP